MTCRSTCPEAVATVNRTEVTMPGFPSLTITPSPLDDGSFDVYAQVAADNLDIPWLIRFWFVTSAENDIGQLSNEALVVPDTPGVSQFFKVTEGATGAVSFNVNHEGAGTWYLCGAIVGTVATSTRSMPFTT